MYFVPVTLSEPFSFCSFFWAYNNSNCYYNPNLRMRVFILLIKFHSGLFTTRVFLLGIAESATRLEKTCLLQCQSQVLLLVTFPSYLLTTFGFIMLHLAQTDVSTSLRHQSHVKGRIAPLSHQFVVSDEGRPVIGEYSVAYRWSSLPKTKIESACGIV